MELKSLLFVGCFLWLSLQGVVGLATETRPVAQINLCTDDDSVLVDWNGVQIDVTDYEANVFRLPTSKHPLELTREEEVVQWLDLLKNAPSSFSEFVLYDQPISELPRYLHRNFGSLGEISGPIESTLLRENVETFFPVGIDPYGLDIYFVISDKSNNDFQGVLVLTYLAPADHWNRMKNRSKIGKAWNALWKESNEIASSMIQFISDAPRRMGNLIYDVKAGRFPSKEAKSKVATFAAETYLASRGLNPDYSQSTGMALAKFVQPVIDEIGEKTTLRAGQAYGEGDWLGYVEAGSNFVWIVAETLLPLKGGDEIVTSIARVRPAVRAETTALRPAFAAAGEGGHILRPRFQMKNTGGRSRVERNGHHTPSKPPGELKGKISKKRRLKAKKKPVRVNDDAVNYEASPDTHIRTRKTRTQTLHDRDARLRHWTDNEVTENGYQRLAKTQNGPGSPLLGSSFRKELQGKRLLNVRKVRGLRGPKGSNTVDTLVIETASGQPIGFHMRPGAEATVSWSQNQGASFKKLTVKSDKTPKPKAVVPTDMLELPSNSVVTNALIVEGGNPHILFTFAGGASLEIQFSSNGISGITRYLLPPS